MDEDEVPLDFDDDSMSGDLEPEGILGAIDQHQLTIEEELRSEMHSPLKKKTRRLVEEFEKDERCPENESNFKPKELLSPELLREQELLPYSWHRFFAILAANSTKSRCVANRHYLGRNCGHVLWKFQACTLQIWLYGNIRK